MLLNGDINIRDPFVLCENGKYYLYGTRAANFGVRVNGFDVYISEDLQHWSEPAECFGSDLYGLNTDVNWAPEVHKYNGAYYMFATFTKPDGLRGTYILKADRPAGPFYPHSDGAVTPDGWECLDGTFYVENGTPYIVFCHEHTQITDGSICFAELDSELKKAVGEPQLLFHGSSPYYIEKKPEGEHYITDGPFMFRTKSDTLLMIWSTFIDGKYAECLVRFTDGSIQGGFEHLEPLVDSDGGHGMIFKDFNGKLYLTYHTPNQTDFERPHFAELNDLGERIAVVERK